MLLVGAVALAWEPAGDRIKTRWASQVDPANCLPEYPRPQMVRARWQNLNGLWNYAIVPEESQAPVTMDGQILVPFCIESSLSGVGKALEPGEALWYETEFRVPRDWSGQRIMLNFGAVDWEAKVFVNGKEVGGHTGGFAPFSLDITGALRGGGAQILTVKVIDPTDEGMPHPIGKQRLTPEAIWYTAVSGIWQTVWIEPVPENGIRDWYAVSDIDSGRLEAEVNLFRAKGNEKIEIELLEGGTGYSTDTPATGKVIASASGASGGKIALTVPDPHLWSPDDPYLYGVRIKVMRGSKVIDKVEGYTQMRGTSVVTTPDGFKRLGLNGKAVFQFGPLDQGWWPDGLYTAPTDDALEYDVVKTKDFGFNMIRKHVKTEPARWYYHCDRLGIVVWQDMPSLFAGGGSWADDKFEEGNDSNVPEDAKANFYREWGEIISSLKGFQCIVVWVPFNESWGQFDTEKVVGFTREQDPTRLINSASGGNHHACGDILDFHHYPEPKMHYFRPEYVNVQGEFGVRAVSPEWGHTWVERDRNHKWWTPADVQKEYDRFAVILKDNITHGCSAAVYCQTADVEDEINGFMTYDRDIVKFPDEKHLRDVNRSVILSMDNPWLGRKCPYDELPQKEMSIQLYSVRLLISPDKLYAENHETVFKELKRMGYTSVEAAGYDGNTFYGVSPEQFRKDVESAGLKVLSSHATYSLSDEEMANHDFTKALEWWKKAIKDHKAAGMKYIVTPSAKFYPDEKSLQTLCDYFNAIGELCNEAGLKYGYHSHAFEYRRIGDGKRKYFMMDYLLEHTDPSKVFFEMDVYWCVYAQQGPAEWFRRYPGRFELLHIKDHRQIGKSGMVGYETIFNEAETAGMKDFVVELEGMDDDDQVMLGVGESAEYIRNAPFVKAKYHD